MIALIHKKGNKGERLEGITRQDLDAVCVLLDKMQSAEADILSTRIRKADIIPRLYQAAYVESMYKILSKFKTFEAFETDIKYSYSDEKFALGRGKSFDAVKFFLNKAHKRQNEVCDFKDATLPENKIGKCNDDNHNENCEDNIKLTEEEQIKFDEINEEEGWNEAWEHFEDKINPDNQKLTLTLNFGQDDTKVLKNDGVYICEKCLEVNAENSEGGITCDLEMAEETS